MSAICGLLISLLVLVTPAVAHAASLFDFEWTSSATYSTLIPVNRVEPDGSITPYDQVRQTGTLAGSGLLTLTLPSTSVDGYTFEFSGTNGAGAGAALPGGEIPPGAFSFSLPADVPVALPGLQLISGGFIGFEGDPAAPSAVSISYFEGSSPHCQFDCSSIQFQGFGRARGNTVAAAEPENALLAAIGLLGVAWLRARARRAGAAGA